MFTADLNDGQWLQCMCTQILNAFTINKVVMHADVDIILLLQMEEHPVILMVGFGPL